MSNKGGRIEVPCNWCGKPKLVYWGRYQKYLDGNKIFCDNKCQWEWRRISGECCGENNPNWQGGPVNVKCYICDTEFEITRFRFNSNKSNHFLCSQKCNRKYWSDELSSRTGEKHPLYSQIIIKCDYCNVDFYQKKSQIEKYNKHFCSNDCKIKWGKENSTNVEVYCNICGSPKIVWKWYYDHHDVFYCSEHKGEQAKGENNYAWKGYVELNCPYCHCDFEARKAYYDTRKKENPETQLFCSKECRVSFRADAIRGENHPNWKGGGSDYGPEFTDSFKEEIRKRDNYECQECGIKQDDIETRLSVHHIDYNKFNNDELNTISLCTSCHSKTNFNREYWQLYFENIMNLRYGSSEDVNED